MEQTEIQQRNKDIALMLGWIYVTTIEVAAQKYGRIVKKAGWYSVIPNHDKFLHQSYKGRNHNHLRFHSDWNWIHKAAESIYSKLKPTDSRRFDLVAYIGKNSKEKAFLIISDIAKTYKNGN